MKTKTILGLMALFIIFVVSLTAASAIETVYGVVNDTTGAQVNGATVELRNYTTDAIVNTTTTNVNGSFNITAEWAQGLYTVNITATGYDDDSFLLPILDDQSYFASRTLGPIAVGTISGTITNGTDPLSGVSIIVTGNNTYYTSTDASGNYAIHVVAPGTYTVLASHAGYGDNSTSSVAITDGSTATVDMQLSALPTTGTLRGYVNNYTNTSEMIDAATVTLRQGSVAVAITTSNSTGNYTVNVPAGTYNVTVSKIGYNDAAASVTITNGAVTEQDFSLIAQGAVCTQSAPVYSAWSTCTSELQNRTVTYYNYTGVCGNTYVTTQTQSCGGSGGGSGGHSSSPRGGGSVVGSLLGGSGLPFTNYVTHFYDELLASKDKYIMEIGSEVIAIYELEFAVKQDVKSTVVISVGKLLDRPERNLDRDNVYEYDVINHQQVNNEEFSYVKARFKVLKEWYTDNNLNVSSTQLHRYDTGDKQWNALPTKLIDQDDTYNYFESDLPGMSEFAIGADKNIESQEDEEKPELIGLSEEEVQRLMDACEADGLKPVPVVGEDGEVLDIECVEYEEEPSLVARAWGVFSNFVKNTWKWIIPAIVVIAVIILLVLFGSRIFAKKDKKPKAEKKQKKDLELVEDANFAVRAWRKLAGRKAAKDEKWFSELDDKDFEKLVKQRRNARLARRKKYLK